MSFIIAWHSLSFEVLSNLTIEKDYFILSSLIVYFILPVHLTITLNLRYWKNYFNVTYHHSHVNILTIFYKDSFCIYFLTYFLGKGIQTASILNFFLRKYFVSYLSLHSTLNNNNVESNIEKNIISVHFYIVSHLFSIQELQNNNVLHLDHYFLIYFIICMFLM